MNFESADEDLDGLSQNEIGPIDEIPKIQCETIDKKATKTIRFEMIVKLFQKMSQLRGVKKGKFLREFLKTIFQASRQPAFVYSIIRLLLPSDDRDRGNYGLKEKGIAKVISDCLGLIKEDYQRLYHYKNPNYHQRGFGIGDFSLCVFDIARNYCKEKSQLTVLDLNILLDQLAVSNANYVPVFRQLFQKANAEEMKWIIRIVLKDLKLSIKLETVLNTYHKDASDYFNLTNSLMEVCKKFENQKICLDDEICLFSPIRPMLAGKKNINYFKNQSREFYLETKYDGERIQAHYDGNEVRLFSRNGVNYSHVYKEIIQLLKQKIQADACILDGQVIVLQKQTLQMVPFGMNKVVALSNNQSDMQLCYMVFDVLWVKVQGEEMNLMKFALKQRKKILQSTLETVKGRLQIVQSKKVNDFDEILQDFGKSIERNEEGIMLKDPESLYVPKQRATNWLKLKGDYIDGLTDTLDLIIIGGYFGQKSYRQGDSSHWIDKITTFSLGVLQFTDEDSYVVYPFCKVGTGYNAEQLALLREKLKNNLTLDDNKFYPKNLKTWKFSVQDKPDCWVRRFQQSLLFQIKAAQIITSDSYPTNSTLRFPRVIKVRYDKDWNEATTIKDIEEMRNNSKFNKNMKRIKEDSDSDQDHEKGENKQNNSKKVKTQNEKQKKTKLKNVLLDDFRCVELGQNDIQKSNLFYGLEFVVLPLIDKNITRHDVEKEILLHGGRVSQNPLNKTNFIVADHIDFRLQIYQSELCRNINVVKPKYIYSCIREEQMLVLSPLYLTCLPAAQRQFYVDSFDKFSDSYTKYISERQLNQILSEMPNDKSIPINQTLIDVIGLQSKRDIDLEPIDEYQEQDI